MDYSVTTRLKGVVAMTSSFHADPVLRRDRSLYKFIWVQRGTLTLVIDHVETQLAAGEIVSLTPLHRIEFGESGAEYLALLFNSDFYCIYGHDDEVSCNGLLFNGSSDVMRLKLTAGQSEALHEITDRIAAEYAVADNLREEMLRILLKRFIITCTRMARERFAAGAGSERQFDIVRRYYVLVDRYFREKKQVQEYALLLHRSPKTLSNLFAVYGLPSPLQVIRDRTQAEAPAFAALYFEKRQGGRRYPWIRRRGLFQPVLQRGDREKHFGIPEPEIGNNCQHIRQNRHLPAGVNGGSLHHR